MGIPKPKHMELLEGLMAHNSTFHSQSSQVFVLTMPGPTVQGQSNRRSRVVLALVRRYGVSISLSMHGLSSISRLLRRRFQICPRKFSTKGSEMLVQRFRFSDSAALKWRQIEQPLSVYSVLCYWRLFYHLVLRGCERLG